MIGIDAFRLFGRVQRALGVNVWLNLVRRGRWRVRVDRGLRFLGHEWFSSRHNVGIRFPKFRYQVPESVQARIRLETYPRLQRLTRYVCETRFGSGMQAGLRIWSPDRPPHKEQGPHERTGRGERWRIGRRRALAGQPW